MNQMKKGVEGMYRSLVVPMVRRQCRCASTTGKVGEPSSSAIKGTQQTVSASTASQLKPEEIVTSERPRRRGVPLDVPLPGLPNPSFSDAELISYETEVTKLSNGLRVASQPRPGRYCTIGVAIKSGSRYEESFTKGVSHVAEKLGFLTTNLFPEKNNIVQEMEKYGAICDAQTSRDTTVYAISTQVSGLEKMMRLLGDAIFRPRLTEDEINNVRQTILYEIEDMQLRPEKEAVILEMVHGAAWSNNTIGFSRYCAGENVMNVTRDELLKYMKATYAPERIVVSGVGVNHKELVDLTKEYFTIDNATWNVEGIPAVPMKDIPPMYTGGDVRIHQDFAQFNAGPLPVPKLAHMALGLKSVPHVDPLFIPACVLNILMGGGGSFSAGGPGKGMYSRLYTNVLNHKHWVYNATAYNNSYADDGLFSIYACAPPEYMASLTEVLIQEFHKMTESLEPEEFDRAKRQLQSMLLMNLESRPVLFEDIGRQILAHGHYKPPTEYMRLIEEVTENDIRKLAGLMLKSKPSMAALGLLDRLPEYTEVVTNGPEGEIMKDPTSGYFRRR